MLPYLLVIALLLVLLAGCAVSPSTSDATLFIAPAPSGEKLSDDFQITIAGQSVPVYHCRVSAFPFNRLWPGHQRQLDQTELASFAAWQQSAPVTLEILSTRPVESAVVRPVSRNIHPRIEGQKITFTLDRPGQVTLEINGTHHALHLFADPPQPIFPNSKDANVRYFGPGIHKPGLITLLSNQTVFLAPGAVVLSSIHADGASNIKILGTGILDSSLYERGTKDPSSCVRLNDCHNVIIDGPIFKDPNGWCVACHDCSELTISNVKLIGLWRFNSDGIDVSNSQNVIIQDSFIRSFDDSLVVKGLLRKSDGNEPRPVKNYLAQRCVIWNDWGRSLEIGAETVAPEISDITFKDCDLIHNNYAALDIQHGDRAHIKNVLYDNIRVEIDDVSEAALIQKSDDDVYQPDKTWIPRLLIIEIVHTMWNKDKVNGTVENVTLRNVSITGKHLPPSRLSGLDAEHAVNNVTIENLRYDGQILTTAPEANLTVKPFVDNVRVISPSRIEEVHPVLTLPEQGK